MEKIIVESSSFRPISKVGQLRRLMDDKECCGVVGGIF